MPRCTSCEGKKPSPPTGPAGWKSSTPTRPPSGPSSARTTTPSSAPSPTRTSYSGIGNAYSDEILHRAKLSPLTWTTRLTDAEADRLFEATCATLTEWTDRLRAETGDGFPEKVTAFRDGMAVHGRFGRPCPACGTAVQRIVYAETETNYCPRCQTGGKVLADRALSKLLRDDWPRTIEELEVRLPRRA